MILKKDPAWTPAELAILINVINCLLYLIGEKFVSGYYIHIKSSGSGGKRVQLDSTDELLNILDLACENCATHNA